MGTITGTTVNKMTSDFVDLHCHILPNIDDGSPTLEDSIELERAAVKDGVRYILATPHHMDRYYMNHGNQIKKQVQQFQEVLNRLKINLTIFPGQEVHLNGDLINNLDDVLGIDTNRKYILLELPHEMVPNYLEEIVFQLSCEGITPVIAHPERNAQIIADPTRLYNLVVNQGALAQVTATSLGGSFGKKVQWISKEFVKAGLVQVVASDAHKLLNRNFAMTKAYFELEQLDTKLPEHFSNNARKLLNGEMVEVNVTRVPKKYRKFLLF
ncbi:capsular polysaccharide biosynthesis protein [Lactiplantibacillus fabifermentans DSM 21115]|uniref:Tyrosine-protein phosphatase n=2 Tax=Lactiplantibacillus fabifermentans TaxID=483011 RepID=A0A0R2NLD2_9LACO|nr:capsular polysaccharide biosynthesis protein [Lactiplantibacillus fabifermentans DSM 21115]